MSDLSSQDKSRILKDAKMIRNSLEKEARKYQNAKVSGRTKEYYQRAKELVRRESSQYTQKAVKDALKSGEDPSDRIAFERSIQKSFGKGSTATNVARRILTTRSEIGGEKAASTSQAGARFYGGLVSIWENEGYDNRDEAIMEAFGTKNLLQVMELLEERLGVDLLDMLSDPEKYHDAVNMIQSYVSESGIG